MKTALNLLNEINDMGFDQQKSLILIDKLLDKELGIEGRKPLFDEKLSDVIYENILGVFRKEAENNNDGVIGKILGNRNNGERKIRNDRRSKY